MQIAVDALDAGNHRLCTQLGNDSVQMLEVIDLQIDGQIRKIRRTATHADIVDIAVMLGNDTGNLSKTSRLIDVLHMQSRRKTLRRHFLDIPANIEPALRLFLEILQRRRLDRINRDPLTRRDDADDAISRHRTTIRRKLHRQIRIDAANWNRG